MSSNIVLAGAHACMRARPRRQENNTPREETDPNTLRLWMMWGRCSLRGVRMMVGRLLNYPIGIIYTWDMLIGSALKCFCQNVNKNIKRNVRKTRKEAKNWWDAHGDDDDDEKRDNRRRLQHADPSNDLMFNLNFQIDRADGCKSRIWFRAFIVPVDLDKQQCYIYGFYATKRQMVLHTCCKSIFFFFIIAVPITLRFSFFIKKFST